MMLSSTQRYTASSTHVSSQYGTRGHWLEREIPYCNDNHSTSINENLLDGQPYSRLVDMQGSISNAFQLNSTQNSPIVPQSIQNTLIHQTGQLYPADHTQNAPHTQSIGTPYRTNSTNNLAEFYNRMIGGHRNVNYESDIQTPTHLDERNFIGTLNTANHNNASEEGKYMFGREQQMTPNEDLKSTYDHYHQNYIASTTYSDNSLEKIDEGHHQQSSHSTLDHGLSTSCTPINLQPLISCEYEKRVIYTPVSAQTSVSELGSLSELGVSELSVSGSTPLQDPGSVSDQITVPDQLSENVPMSKQLPIAEHIRMSEHNYALHIQQDTPTKLNISKTKETEETKEMKETVSQSRHICNICHKRFQRPSSLQIHHYTHTGEKFFECPDPTCGKKFSVKSNMTRHYKLHQRGQKRL